jgi:hypothetical protein
MLVALPSAAFSDDPSESMRWTPQWLILKTTPTCTQACTVRHMPMVLRLGVTIGCVQVSGAGSPVGGV